MCRLQNKDLRDYQESVTTGQTGGRTDGQTDAGQSDPYVPLCFADDTKSRSKSRSRPLCQKYWYQQKGLVTGDRSV